jgi:hypothetical protein
MLLISSTAYADWPDFAVSEPVLMEIDGSKDTALIVAIEQYESLAKIPGARTNAEDWVQFLRSSLRMPSQNLVRLHDRDAKAPKIRSALRELVKRTARGGRVWFVFIGHGAPSQQAGDGVLAGYDAGPTAQGLEQRGLHRSELMQILGTRARDKVSGIAILDASFSGKSARVADLAPAAIRRTIIPSGVVLMTGAGDDELAGPLPGVSPERPAFSYLVLGALRGWADKNKDGRVSAREAVSYTDSTLQATLDGAREQHPSLDASDPNLVLSDGTEEAPALRPRLMAEADMEPEYGPPLRDPLPSSTRDSGEPAHGRSDEEEALAHGIGSFAVGIGGGAPYNTFVLFGEGAIGARFGQYIRLTGVVLAAASDFSSKDASAMNPSLRPTIGVSGAAGLGVELARNSLISVSADALGGVTYIGERCDNALGDGAGNLICDRVQPSAIGPAGGVRLAMQVRVSGSDAGLRGASSAQGVLISGTAMASKPTGLFGGVFLGYGAW